MGSVPHNFHMACLAKTTVPTFSVTPMFPAYQWIFTGKQKGFHPFSGGKQELVGTQYGQM